MEKNPNPKLSRREAMIAMGFIAMGGAAILTGCDSALGNEEVTNTDIPSTNEPTIKPRDMPISTDTLSPTVTPSPTETQLVERFAEFSAKDDMTVRMWLPKPIDIDSDRGVMPYGLVEYPRYISFSEVEEGVHLYWVSGILLETPEVDGDIFRFKIGIPDYNTGEFREFTVVHDVVWHEDNDPNKTPKYPFRSARPHGSEGGYNVDSGVSDLVLEQEALERFRSVVGYQVAWLIDLGVSLDRTTEYFNNYADSYCNQWDYCLNKFDKIIDGIPDAWSILSALRDNNPAGYEGKDLFYWFGSATIPVN